MSQEIADKQILYKKRHKKW